VPAPLTEALPESDDLARRLRVAPSARRVEPDGAAEIAVAHALAGPQRREREPCGHTVVGARYLARDAAEGFGVKLEERHRAPLVARDGAAAHALA
jgi:hypothetical protein